MMSNPITPPLFAGQNIDKQQVVNIIVPVYNAQAYLSRCVDSILSQTYKAFLLLLVDDGSTDASGKLCDDYANKDKRVKVIHKQNGGVSSARNAGIEQTSGGFIIFIDADDFIEPDYLERMLACDADLVLGGAIYFGGELPHQFNYPKERIDKECIGEWLHKWLVKSPVGVPWSKVFKADIIQKYHIRFDEHLRVGEDHVFTHQYLLHCTSLQTTDYAGYNYYTPISAGPKYLLNADEAMQFHEKVLGGYQAIAAHFHFENEGFIYQTKLFAVRAYINFLRKKRPMSVRAWREAFSFFHKFDMPSRVLRYCHNKKDKLIALVVMNKF